MKNKLSSLLILFTLLLFPFIVKAQTNYEDVVYLKNGSIIHGMIIELIPNTSIKIQTKDENIFVCKMEEIEKITKEETEKGSAIDYKKIKKHGYINITETSFGTGGGASIGIQTINGYLINPVGSVGLGTGLDIDKENNLTLIPLFADVRVYLLEKPVSPYMCMAAGYSFNLESNIKGGRMINPSLGIRAYLSSKAAILFSLGYKLQAYSESWTYNNQAYTDKENVGYINFKIGFMF